MLAYFSIWLMVFDIIHNVFDYVQIVGTVVFLTRTSSLPTESNAAVL